MKGFILGFILGATVASGAASAALIVGQNGYLTGWSVTKDGEEVRDSPYAWTATREIECD